jgi:hypothetical protein
MHALNGCNDRYCVLAKWVDCYGFNLIFLMLFYVIIFFKTNVKETNTNKTYAVNYRDILRVFPRYVYRLIF